VAQYFQQKQEFWWRWLTRILDEDSVRDDDSSVHQSNRLLWFFRCWHRKVSRPFTRDGHTFCVCLKCGMRRDFDVKNWKLTGGYYYARELAEYGSLSRRKGTKR
jgi:hypothetical protein